MKTLLFLRHGKTNYTGIFPDLTDDGKEEISKAADEILEIVKDMKSVRIVSSQLPRALGTAGIIAKRLQYADKDIDQELAIRCMDFLNNELATALWSGFASARDVDRAYKHDLRFESGEAVEKRSAIQQRFNEYLEDLFAQFIADKLADVTIHSSHYEVLWNLADVFGFEEPLIHGELIRMDLTNSSRENHICIRITFRGSNRDFDCKSPHELFGC